MDMLCNVTRVLKFSYVASANYINLQHRCFQKLIQRFIQRDLHGG